MQLPRHKFGSGIFRMRRGCLDFFLRLGTSVVSATLIAIGALLLLVGLLSSSPLSGAQTALSILAAVTAAYLFIRVGRSIWRDLREPHTPNREKENSNRAPDE